MFNHKKGNLPSGKCNFQIHFLVGPGGSVGHHYLRAARLHGLYTRVLALGRLVVPHHRIGQGHLHRSVGVHIDRTVHGAILRHCQSTAEIAGGCESMHINTVCTEIKLVGLIDYFLVHCRHDL